MKVLSMKQARDPGLLSFWGALKPCSSSSTPGQKCGGVDRAQTQDGSFLVPWGQQPFRAFAQSFLILWNYSTACKLNRTELRQIPEHYKDAVAAPNATREIWYNRNPPPPLFHALKPQNQHNCLSSAKDKLKRKKQNKIISSSLYHKKPLKQ